MDKVTLTKADGTTEDFFPQSYTDAAVAAAVAAVPKDIVAEAKDVEAFVEKTETPTA